jgi:hypothetical protein
MGEVFWGIPETLARLLVRDLGLRGAVETGTHLGDSAVKLRELVPEVWTIELSEYYIERARDRHRGASNVHFMQGRSDAVLRELASKWTAPMLYWLDAHWCGRHTAGSEAQCPVLGEIEALDESPSAASSVVMIDDARFFIGAPDVGFGFRREDWPTFMQVADALRATHPRYVTTFQDVIIAGPPSAQAVVEAYWHEHLAGGSVPPPVAARQLFNAARQLIKSVTPPSLWQVMRRARGR